ncbi:glycerolphosphate mutase, putative [Bodo saltans]|uniref:Glycerolphosphate mutase, putative n=1 Tax=Bodo saltans TaxID=75058 RepID=A0A0S4J4W8_BODSA|nr:glycerolphosphate mutase, putative [Bodo saltans]|eukprot:CUG86260.1 glycerolphosphate mutase, putative [Bodo saltans]
MLPSLRGTITARVASSSGAAAAATMPGSNSSFLLLPKRLLLVRHGESAANADRSVYSHTPDWKIPLTDLGQQQAKECAASIKDIVQQDKVYLYTSPYRRARQTLEHIRAALDPNQVEGEREDERLREQEMGNFQPYDQMKATWEERQQSSRFYYRFPNGESGSDVCDRVSLFLDSLFRERREMVGALQSASGGGSNLEGCTSSPEDHNIVIVCHGLFVRLFISRWYKLPVEIFELLYNPPNCGVVVLERDDNKGRLVMRQDCKALFGSDPRVLPIQFDGSDHDRWYRTDEMFRHSTTGENILKLHSEDVDAPDGGISVK